MSLAKKSLTPPPIKGESKGSSNNANQQQAGRRAKGARSGAIRQSGGINKQPQVVEEPTQQARQCVTSGVKKLHLHDLSFTGQDLVVNSDGFPHLRDGDIVQIFQPNKPERKFTLTVKWLSSVTDKTNTRLQVSLLKSIAEVFGLQSFSEIQLIGPIDPASVETEVSFVEFHFKDQFVSRADLWRFKNEVTANVPAHKGKMFNLVGFRAKVEELKMGNHRHSVESGILTAKTKVIFRSRSTRIFWLVQMSIEMWQPHDGSGGELCFQRFINRFVKPLLKRWRDDETAHSVSIVFFTRTFLEDGDVIKPPHEEGGGVRLQRDLHGRLFRDYYKMVLENQDLAGMSVIHKLKEEFISFPRQVGLFGGKGTIPCSAPQGNVLEAINLTLNILDKHHMDRDLTRTGNSIVIISPSNGNFRVHEKLSKITKQRMMDNGIGMDMISLGAPPLHTVPLFIHRTPYGNDKFEMPYWTNLSFLSHKYMAEELAEKGKPEEGPKAEVTASSSAGNTSNSSSTNSQPSSGPGSGGTVASSTSASVATSGPGNGSSAATTSNTTANSTPASSSSIASTNESSTSSGLGLDGDLGSSSIDPERGRFGFGGDAIEFAAGLRPPPKGVRTDNGVKVYPMNYRLSSNSMRMLPPALNAVLNSTCLLDSIHTSGVSNDVKVSIDVDTIPSQPQQHILRHSERIEPKMKSFIIRDIKSELCPKPIITSAIRNAKGQLVAHAPPPPSHAFDGSMKYEPSGLSSLLKSKEGTHRPTPPSPQKISSSLNHGDGGGGGGSPMMKGHSSSMLHKSSLNARVLSKSPDVSYSAPKTRQSGPSPGSWESGVLAGSALISMSISPQNTPSPQGSPPKASRLTGQASSSYGAERQNHFHQAQKQQLSTSLPKTQSASQTGLTSRSSPKKAVRNLSIEEQMNEFDDTYWLGAFASIQSKRSMSVNSFGSGGGGGSGRGVKREVKVHSANSYERTASSVSLDSMPSMPSDTNLATMYVGSEGGRLSDGKLSESKSTVAMVPEASVMPQAPLSEHYDSGPVLSRMTRSQHHSSNLLLPEVVELALRPAPTPATSTSSGYERRLSNYMANVVGSTDSGYALYFAGSSISPENNYFSAPRPLQPPPITTAVKRTTTAIPTTLMNLVSSITHMNPPSFKLMPDNRRLHAQQQQLQQQQQQQQHQQQQQQQLKMGNQAHMTVALHANEEDEEFINPFRQESQLSVMQYRTHARRRWTYLSETDDSGLRFRQLGLNFKSLSTPAMLPLNTDYVPHLRELESERYSQRPDPVALPRDSISDMSYVKLVREIVMQRLACDFQLVDSDDADTSTATLESIALQKRGPRITTLTMGHRIHRIEIAAPFTHVKVTEYASVLATQSMNLGTSQPHHILNGVNNGVGPNGAGGGGTTGLVGGIGTNQNTQNKVNVADESFGYQYMNWDKLSSSFQLMQQSFQQFPESLAWNSVDQLIVTPMIHLDPYPMRARNTRYKRILFVVIPPSPLPSTLFEVKEFFKSRTAKVTMKASHLARSTSAPISPTSASFASSAPFTSSGVTNSTSSVVTTNTTSFSSSTKYAVTAASPTSKSPSPTSSTSTSTTKKIQQDPTESFLTQLNKLEVWLNSIKSSGSEVLNIKVKKIGDEKPVGKTLVTVPFTNKRPWSTGDRCEWALVVPDSDVRKNSCYRIEVNWLLCTGYNVGELVSLLYKQCAKAGLRLAQVPQHTLSEHLSIHSFNGASWISVENQTISIVMELGLRERFSFISDAKQITNWKMSFPFLDASMIGEKAASHRLSHPRPMVGPNYKDADPQYIHQKGIAMVRVCSNGKGFAWVMNSLRVSDVHLTHSAKFHLCVDLMAAFRLELKVTTMVYHCVIVPLSILANRHLKASRAISSSKLKEENVSKMKGEEPRKDSPKALPSEVEPKGIQNAMLLWMIVQYLDPPQKLADIPQT